MSVAYVTNNGYGPQVGRSSQGYPIYLYTDPHSRLMSYVVVKPDGRAFYSDDRGNVRQPHPEADVEVVSAMVSVAIVGGGVGAIAGLGPVGAVVGAIAGAIAGKMLKRQPA